jgi:hypothetical protein
VHLAILQDLAIALAGEAASALVADMSAAYYTQLATDTGPLTQLDELELRHWMHQFSFAAHAAIAAALRRAACEHSAAAAASRNSIFMQPYDVRAVLVLLRMRVRVQAVQH